MVDDFADLEIISSGSVQQVCGCFFLIISRESTTLWFMMRL